MINIYYIHSLATIWN